MSASGQIESSMPRAMIDMRSFAKCAAFTALVFAVGGAAGQEPLPAKPAPPIVAKAAAPPIPTKDYAQGFVQPFKGGVRPEGWNFTSRLAEQCVQFEQAGVRIALPAGEPAAAGLRSGFGVKGDFEITVNFEVLKDPDPADVGKAGTRFGLSLSLDTPRLDTPQSETATLNRSMATHGFSAWARTRHQAAPFSRSFAIPVTTGRLRLVRSGDELFYLAAVGAAEPFQFLTKCRFGAEDLQKRIRDLCVDRRRESLARCARHRFPAFAPMISTGPRRPAERGTASPFRRPSLPRCRQHGRQPSLAGRGGF